MKKTILDEVSKDEKQIRTEVFIQEQGFHNEFDDIDHRSRHIVLYKDDEPAGCYRFFMEKDKWIIGRVAVRKKFRKLGYGAELIRCAEEEIRKKGGKIIRLGAQVTASGFYETLGFHKTNETYLDEGCPHVFMEKIL